MTKKIILVINQIIVVNIILFGTFSYYDDLPRVITVLFFFFIFPVATPLILRIVWEKTIPATEMTDNDLMPSMIVAVTIWIALLTGLYTPVKDYFKIDRYGKLQIQSVNELSTTGKAAYLIVEKTQPQPNLKGLHSYTSYSKSGETQVKTDFFYLVIPAAKNNEGQHNLFLGFDATNNYGEIQEEAKPYLTNKAMQVEGVIVQDPYEQAKYAHAVDAAEKKHSFEVAENYTVINPKDNFEKMKARYKVYAIWYWAIVNLIWVVFPAVLILRSPRK